MDESQIYIVKNTEEATSSAPSYYKVVTRTPPSYELLFGEIKEIQKQAKDVTFLKGLHKTVTHSSKLSA